MGSLRELGRVFIFESNLLMVLFQGRPFQGLETFSSRTRGSFHIPAGRIDGKN